MKFSLKEFKKVKSTPTMSLLRHEGGHELKIDHSKIHPKMRGELEAMPLHAAEGTDTEPEIDLNEEDVNPMPTPTVNVTPEQEISVPKTKKAQEKEIQFEKEPSQEESLKALGAQEPQANKAPPAVINKNPDVPPQAPQSRDPFGYGAMGQQYGEGVGQAKAAALLGMQSDIQQGRQQQESLKNYQDSLAAMQGMTQQHLSDLQKERASLMSDIENQHINPNQFWEDKSIPGKISSAIGLILGGIGGGLMHQENPALKFLNNQIERNINAQRLNLGKSETLLNANRQNFENERDAQDMTRVNLNDIVSNQLKMAAANTSDMRARQNALNALSQINLNTAQMAQSIAMRQGMMSGIKQGVIDPATLVQFSGLVPDHQKESAMKEIANAQENKSLQQDMENSAQDLQSKTLEGAFSPHDRQSAINAFAGRIAKVGEGRFNLQEAELQAKALLPAPLDSAETLKNKAIRRKMFFQSMGQTPNLDSIYNGLGIQNPLKTPMIQLKPPVLPGK